MLEQVRVGLPTGTGDPESGQARNGAWAPVYVKLHAGKQAIAADSLRLVLDSTDSEDSAYEYVTPLPFVEAEQDCFAITYARPGSMEVNLSLQTADGKSVPFWIRTPEGRDAKATRITRDFNRNYSTPNDVFYLTLGSRLSLFRDVAAAQAAVVDEAPDEERKRHKLTFLDTVRDLPDRWFGYEAADIVVLTTANVSFINELRDPAAASRRKALGEWVRRGGKLIVAIGRNRQVAAELLDELSLSEFDKQPLINCKIDGAITRQPAVPLTVLTRWASVGRDPPPLMELVELTRLQPNSRPDASPRAEWVNALVRETPAANDKEGAPVIVHAACGLGRVVLVAFDLDTAPFTTWPGQKVFWEKLQAELSPRVTVGRQNPRAGQFGMVLQDEQLGADLKRGLESFQEVPVISFGWVALFILVYILIVGPVDYLILKKVFKRLELTWITFPTVVVAISVAAYFTAYSLKGDDLRINKIDVIDLDLHDPTPEAYGTTWVTLFSPRIQNYTIGIEPSGPQGQGWGLGPAKGAATTKDARAPRPMVTVMEGIEGINGRPGSQGLFRRAYSYAADAAGLENVSIPVWSMRTFSAAWRAPLTPGEFPVDAELRHARDKNDHALLGRVTNHLPVELRDVTLLYNGRAYSAGTVAPGSFVAIDNLKVGELAKQASQWLVEGSALAAGSSRTVTNPALIRDLLFHSPPAQAAKSNDGWRTLDQSWRLRPLVETSSLPQPQSRYRDEVMLVARVPSQASTSESVTRSDAAPTRLWLGLLPGGRDERPSLSGYIVQDVYIRAFIPVAP